MDVEPRASQQAVELTALVKMMAAATGGSNDMPGGADSGAVPGGRASLHQAAAGDGQNSVSAVPSVSIDIITPRAPGVSQLAAAPRASSG